MFSTTLYQYPDFKNEQMDQDLWSRWLVGETPLEDRQVAALILDRHFAPLPLPWKNARLPATDMQILERAFGLGDVSCHISSERKRT